MLLKVKNGEENDKLKEERKAVWRGLIDIANQEDAKAAEEIIQHAEDIERTNIQLSEIVASIRKFTDYTEIEIGDAFRSVMMRTKSAGKSEDEISREVFQLLEKQHKKTKPITKSRKTPMYKIREEVEGIPTI